jgi:isopenicillin N synthase-like dioxygenase
LTSKENDGNFQGISRLTRARLEIVEARAAATIPVIDVAPLLAGERSQTSIAAVAEQVDDACRRVGFFAIAGHGVPDDLCADLLGAASEFFARPVDEKRRISMDRGGRAWRGWFPLDGELTSGAPDHKEGIYFGSELPVDDPRVERGTPMHGPNLFPAEPARLRGLVLEFMDRCRSIGAALVDAIAVALDVDAQWTARNITDDPLVLFRIFHYPPVPADRWSVGEHTDYGLLTILLQDGTGGLQVHGPDGWIDVPPEPALFVCNVGDMLEHMTGGRYRSTPHRVLNTTARERLSCPFFYDPNWDAHIVPVGAGRGTASPRARARWDGSDPSAFDGTYGEYITGKVAKVFPALRDATR